MIDTRGFLVTARTLKKHWFRENEIEVEITDGANTYCFRTVGSFTISTDIPFPLSVIRKD